MKLSNFKKLQGDKKDMSFFYGFIVDDDNENFEKITSGFTELTPKDIPDNFNYPQLVTDLRKDTLALTEHRQSVIKGTIDLKEKKMLYFSIPYDMGWSIKVDGEKQDVFLTNIGFLGAVIEPGKHDIVLTYYPPFYKASLWGTRIGYIIFILMIILRNYKSILNLPNKVSELKEKYLSKEEETETTETER